MKLDATTQIYIHNLINTYHLIIDSSQQQLEPIQLLEQIITYYQDIIDCLPGNVYWFDKNCIAIGGNKNTLKMLGLTSLDQFKGLNYEEIGRLGNWGEQETLFFKQQSLYVIKEGKSLLNVEEPPIPNEKGEIIYFLSNRTPLFDRNKNVIGYTGISIDITELKKTQLELKQAKEEAEQSSKEKSEFVANMSHDIKTPLAGIIGLAEILCDQLQREEDKHLAEAIHQSGRELLNFFEHCLEIFKNNSKNVEEENQLFRLSDILSEIHSLFEPTIITKNLEFSINQHSNCPDHVRGNRSYLHRTLLNLVGNAIKFTKQGSIKIDVSAKYDPEQQHHQFTFKIKDTGIGIPIKYQKIIFKQFTKLTPSYKGTYDGYGIGLYLVDSFVKAMNGKINVVSKKNKGSTFTVTVPMHVEALLPQTIQVDHTNKSIEHRYNILIVEDHPVTQLIYQKMFSSLKQNVTLIDNGEQAIELFQSQSFDMAFIDLGLPGIQGDEVCQIFRQIEKQQQRKAIPIIVLTAHLTQEIDTLLKQNEIDAICNKPLSKDMLIQLMDSLGSRNIQHEFAN